MDAKQMAEIVGATVKTMVEEQAQIQAGINTALESQVNALVGYVTQLGEAVGVLAEKVDNPMMTMPTPEQVEEQAAAYRGSIIMEAARLGVTGGELARAKKVVQGG